MKVHLIKSKELSTELFTRVVNILSSIKGPIEFEYEKDSESIIDFEFEEFSERIFEHKKDFETKQVNRIYSLVPNDMDFPKTVNTVKWKSLFDKCKKYRKERRIDSNSFVILLTDIPNDKNWFAVLDENMPYNGFVHTADWNYYINCPSEFPIAYEVIALILHKYTFKNYHDLMGSVHLQPMGCVSDLCTNKKEIILKLRTADMCRECFDKLKQNLSLHIIHHAMDILSSLREKMLFAQSFGQYKLPSKVRVTPQYKIFLPGFANIEATLRPMEKVVYLLFLRNPKGIILSHIREHYDELLSLYGHISNSSDLQNHIKRIGDLTNPLSQTLSQQISRIKNTVTSLIGDELADLYIIQGPNGDRKKIKIAEEPEMIIWEL